MTFLTAAVHVGVSTIISAKISGLRDLRASQLKIRGFLTIMVKATGPAYSKSAKSGGRIRIYCSIRDCDDVKKITEGFQDL